LISKSVAGPGGNRATDLDRWKCGLAAFWVLLKGLVARGSGL